MRRNVLLVSLIVGFCAVSGDALAQTAFVEGHVFNKRTGAPLEGAWVRVHENVTQGPVPVELASGATDANGFYQFEIDTFLGTIATIKVVCDTPRREFAGGSSARLRDATIRRDIYVQAPWRIRRCLAPE